MIACLIIFFILHIIEFTAIICLVHYVNIIKSDLIRTIDCIDRVLTQVVKVSDKLEETETKDF